MRHDGKEHVSDIPPKVMDNKEFESLARKLRPTLCKAALRIVADPMTADDVVQDTLLKLWVLRERLDEYSSVEGLAVTISRRLAINYLRDHNPAQFTQLSPQETGDTDSGQPSAEDEMIARENSALLGKAIEALPAPQQTLVRLRHIEGLDNDEIARLIGSSPGAVRTALCRARQNVAKIFMAHR